MHRNRFRKQRCMDGKPRGRCPGWPPPCAAVQCPPTKTPDRDSVRWHCERDPLCKCLPASAPVDAHPAPQCASRGNDVVCNYLQLLIFYHYSYWALSASNIAFLVYLQNCTQYFKLHGRKEKQCNV